MDSAYIKWFNVKALNLVSDSVRGYVYLLLSAQTGARMDILDSPAAQQIYLDNFNDIVERQVETAADIERYQHVFRYARYKVDFGIAKGVYMIPSNMLLNMGNIEGYNSNSYSERICLIKLKSRSNNLSLIQVYAPDTTYPDSVIDEFYDSLHELIKTVPNRDFLVIMGDFNAKVRGIEQQDVIGKYSNLQRGSNDRGERLVSFCKQNTLVITNTLFKHRSKWTWSSPGDRVHNTIDYILIRQATMKSVIDTHVLSHPDISDHRPVRCKVKLSIVRKKCSTPPNKRFNLDKLKDADTQNLFQQSVKESLEKSNPENDPQQLMDAIEKSVMETSTKILGKPVNENNSWISERTHQAIRDKRENRKNFGTCSIEYKIAKSTVKKLCKIDKESAIEKDHQELNSLPNDVRYFITVKKLKLKQTRNVHAWEMKTPTGKILTNIDEILENWAQFYENLYHNEQNTITNLQEHNVIPPVLKSELDNALQKLKNNKAPGPDAITAEMLKYGGEKLHTTLHKLANLIIAEHAKPPNQLDLSEIIVLFKKDDPLDCSNYRPICLLCHVYKLIMMIIYNRISADLIRALPTNQSAYQKGRGTIEQIQTLQQVIEKVNEYNGSGVICFIDFTKAFDSVYQDKLWQSLSNQTNVDTAY